MATVTINLRPGVPYYRGTKTLDGEQYSITVRWNTTTEKWYMDLSGLNNSVDIKGIALLPGKDLLKPFGWGNILGSLWVVDGMGKNDNPNYADMGSRWTLVYTPRAV